MPVSPLDICYTVEAFTPNCSAILRRSGPPGARRATWIFFGAKPAENSASVAQSKVCIFVKGPSKTQGGLDLREMNEARYHCPIHNDGTDGAHHGHRKKYQWTGPRGRIVLAGVMPFFGIGHDYHLASKGPFEKSPEEVPDLRHSVGAGLSSPCRPYHPCHRPA